MHTCLFPDTEWGLNTCFVENKLKKDEKLKQCWYTLLIMGSDDRIVISEQDRFRYYYGLYVNYISIKLEKRYCGFQLHQ